MSLPLFHAIMGCDTVSAFAGRCKKTAWDVWMSHDDVTDVFSQLSTSPDDLSDEHLAVLERFCRAPV